MLPKLGSLFDGSGGFPLAGLLCDIEPIWASEVEPYPIAVTRSRFPYMRHLGDVSKLNGAEVEPVDVITFGSPCQDLSVAGKRAGLKHEDNGDDETTRSGMFMEAVRIIKEMRDATDGKYPSFALWENVPGAFSSNKGEDFRIVLEELIKVVEPSASVPPAGKNGWPYEDCYMGAGWSLAYRVLDAQYWGVPQRRRRIYLVADFRGGRAGEVLFKREGLRGYFEAGRTPWKEAAGNAGGSAQTANGTDRLISVASFKAGQGAQARSIGWDMEKTPTLAADAGGNSVPSVCMVYDSRGNGDGKIVPTLTGDHENRVTDYTAIVVNGTIPINDKATRWRGGGASRDHDGSGNGLGVGKPGDPFPTLTAGDRHAVFYAMQCFGEYRESDVSSTIKTRDCKSANDLAVAISPARYIVRRLTPTECARLQGFPDKWGHPDHKDDLTDEEHQFWQEVRDAYATINGKPAKVYTKAQMLTWYNKLHTDSAEYKMWGNGIALPTALYVMQGISIALRGGQNDGE